MNSERRIIALAGLSGSGKTTLITRAKKSFNFAHFSASDLVKKYNEESELHVDSETLRLGDINANQIALIHAFIKRSGAIEENIVFDRHTVIDTPTALEVIPAQVFGTIGITDFVFLSVDPKVIFERRQRDVRRIRPMRSPEELVDHQNKAAEVGRDIANALGIPFVKIGEDPDAELAAVLNQSS